MIAAILGSIFNRFRGGGLQQLAWDFGIGSPKPEEGLAKSFSKILNDIVFAAYFTWFLDFSLDRKGLICYAILHITMLAGRCKGWGVYMEDLASKTVTHRAEVEAIDAIALRGDNFPRLRNSFAISLRGVIWTSAIMVGFFAIYYYLGVNISSNIFWLPSVGLLMGIVYGFSMEICGKFNIKTGRGYGQTVGEVVWGAVLWGSCQFLLGV
jgi:hypothetical protein